MRRRLFVVCVAVLCGVALQADLKVRLYEDHAADPELRALVEANRFRKAQPLLEAAVKANPNDAEAAWLLARVRLALGHADAALPLAEKAATLQPKDATYRQFVAEVVGRQAQQANMFSQIGLGRRVKREAEAALALDPNHPDSLETLMEFYRQAPGIVGGDKAKAREMAARLRTVSPADGILAEASLAADEKRLDQLEGLYRKAVEAGPAHAGARRALANYLLQPTVRNWSEAEPHARQLVTLAPGRADSYALLAAALAGQKKFAELDATLVTAEATVPENRWPFYRAGNALLVAEADFARAEKYFRHYLAQPPDVNMPSHAGAHWRLGLALEKQGRKSDAVAALKQAVAADPKLEGAKADLRRLQ